MGPQSCGKSTVAKIISFCTWLDKKFSRDSYTKEMIEMMNGGKIPNYINELKTTIASRMDIFQKILPSVLMETRLFFHIIAIVILRRHIPQALGIKKKNTKLTSSLPAEKQRAKLSIFRLNETLFLQYII
jgi:hypothetical protein